MRKSKTKKAKVDEVRKTVAKICFHHTGVIQICPDHQFMVPVIRALVRKAYYIGQIEWHERHDTVNWTENLKDRRFVKLFGVKP